MKCNEQDNKWFLLSVKSKTENRVINELKALKDVNILDIKSPKIKNSAGRLSYFMPGYVFIQIDKPSLVLTKLKKVSNILKILSDSNNIPIPVTNAQLEILLSKSDTNLIKSKKFAIGSKVFIKKGPFKDNSGIVENFDLHKNKITVSISVLGKSIPIELSFEEIEELV